MKKIFVLFIVGILALFCAGCSRQEQQKEVVLSDQDPFTAEIMMFQSLDRKDFKRAIWISYLDLVTLVSSDTGRYEQGLEVMMENLKTLEITDIFFHVRSDGDSLAKSALFPSASTTRYPDMSSEYDYVQTAVEMAHRYGIRIHAWVNPYRLQKNDNEIYRAFTSGLKEKDESIIAEVDGNLFLNPASEITRQTVIEGVRELIEAYDFDGVHLDDYFYPTTDLSVDETYYEQYRQNGGLLDVEDWRRENVLAMISGIQAVMNSTGRDLMFGISPDGSIDRNYNRHYLDIYRICAGNEYVDYICPQIYYGYHNEALPFLPTLEAWAALCDGCDLMAGLSFYKVGTEDQYAGTGNQEWRERFDVISRQYNDSMSIENCVGVGFYRYESLFAPAEAVSAYAEVELYNLKNVI